MAQPAKKPQIQQKQELDSTMFFGDDFQSTVEKRSSSNMFYNTRSITVLRGVLSYFQKAYPIDTDFYKICPKHSVHVSDIISIDIPKKPKKPNTVMISFLTKKRFTPKGQNWTPQQPNPQAPTPPPDKKLITVWEFVFPTSEPLKNFVFNTKYQFTRAPAYMSIRIRVQIHLVK